MSVKFCVSGTLTVVGVTFLLFVSSTHFGTFCNIIVANVKSMSRDTTTRPQAINSSDICTVDLFRNYYRTMNYFPGEGRWHSRRRNHKNVSATLFRFLPDLCKFHFDGFQSLPSVNVRRCLRRRNITRITVVGDSNAARYYAALLMALNGSDDRLWKCVNMAAEANDHSGLIPDVRYFARHDRRLLPLLRATVRHCSSCVSRVDRCSRQNSKQDSDRNGTAAGDNEWTLWLEHVSMASMLDSTIKIDIPHNHFVVNHRYRADTFQEFLLKYYLRSRYPDLIIIFPPFNHDKIAETTSSLASRLQYFLSLMDIYLPNDVQVIWMPSFAEFESRKAHVWANLRSHGLLATQKLDAFNRLLYDQLKHRLLKQTSLTYGFFDLVRVSAERESWSLDGIHMDPQWYQLIMSYLLQVFCGPDILLST